MTIYKFTADAAVRDSKTQQAEAWSAVWELLVALDPDFMSRLGTGRQKALLSIRNAFAATPRHEAVKDALKVAKTHLRNLNKSHRLLVLEHKELKRKYDEVTRATHDNREYVFAYNEGYEQGRLDAKAAV